VNDVPIIRAAFLDLRFYKPTSFQGVRLDDYDVIHVHGIGAQLDYLALAKWSHRRPIILSTHGAIFHTESLRWVKQQYFFRFQPLVLAQVDLVAACSRSDAELFGKVSRRVQLIENAADVDALLALPLENKRHSTCLYVGRLAPNKDIESLLRVFAFAKQRGASFELRLAGPDSPHSAAYKSLARELGLADRVQFLGAVTPDRLLAEYDRADLFVSASRYEGFGLSAIEARAAGCRLLVQRNAAFRALFTGDPAVTLADYASVDVAGTSLTALLANRGHGGAGRSRMERYSWTRRIQDWLTVYRRAAAHSHA
jgi:alpha-1,3-mannosyltransferase